MRICKTCKNELPDERFGVSKKTDKSGVVRTYRDSTCMVCRRNSYLKKDGKREIHRNGSNNWYHKNPDRAKSQRLKKYGIDLEGYNKLREEQDYRCAICSVHEKDAEQGRAKTPETALHVDHCHKTNKIRGLLCMNCNNLLGKAKDSCLTLAKAMLYLGEK